MKRQRGVALITVLLVVALASLVTAGLVLRQQVSIRSSTNQLLARQAWHFALGGEALAQAILWRDQQAATDPARSTDHLGEAWARAQPPFALEQGELPWMRQTGLRLKLRPAQEDALVADASGDTLDAVLCLVLAAWAQLHSEAGHPQWGMPSFDPLEGWIAGASAQRA